VAAPAHRPVRQWRHPAARADGPRRWFSAYRNGGVGELLVIAPVHAIELGLPWFIQHPYGL
jgi:hypothetical protein